MDNKIVVELSDEQIEKLSNLPKDELENNAIEHIFLDPEFSNDIINQIYRSLGL